MKLKNLFIGLGFLIIAIYGESINGSFHFDDSHVIQNNQAVQSPANILNFWIDPKTSSFIPENRVYRPLTFTLYSISWWMGSGHPWPFHIMKIFMHWMVAFALFLIWRRLWSEPQWFPQNLLTKAPMTIKFPFTKAHLTINPSSAAALLSVLFAIHPAGSECVDYIAATTSLQCAMFYIWAFFFYLQYRDSKYTKSLLLSLLFYFFSVASKEEGITLPAMVLITEIFLSNSPKIDKIRKMIKISLPYIVLGIFLGAWIYWMRPESGNESRGTISSWEYFMTQWRAYLYYIKIWFWPWDLNADNVSTEFSKSITDSAVIQALIGNSLILLTSWLYRKRFPAFLFGTLWFYITIAPASSIVVLAEPINEHRMYLSYIGFVGGTFTILLALIGAIFDTQENYLKRNSKNEKILGFTYSLIVIALAWGTHQRNQVWANDENLWTDTVNKNPTSGRALNNLALVYMQRGELEKADTYLAKCELYWPSYSYCAINRGIIYHTMAKTAENSGNNQLAATKLTQAEKYFLRAYELQPRNVYLNFRLADFYKERKKNELALKFYKTASALSGTAQF